MANYSRVTLWNHQSLQPPLSLPYEEVSIWTGQQKIYRNFTSSILDYCSISSAESYYRNKYSWTNQDFQSINWDAINTAMHMCSPATRTWIGKFSCGFIGTGQMMARREQWLEMACPCCGVAAETNIHVMQCPDPANRQSIQLDLKDLSTCMKSMGVGKEFTSQFEQCTDAWLDNKDVTNGNSPPFPFRAQLALGWHHLILGRIHLGFQAHVETIYTTRGVRREAQRFIALLIQRLWTRIIRPIWSARNQKVHALDKNTSETRPHQDIKVEVSELYNSTNIEMLPHPARKLFDEELSVILERPYHSLKAWCSSVEMEVSKQSSTYDDPNDTPLKQYSL